MKSLILLTASILCSFAFASGGGPSAADALKASTSTAEKAVVRFNETEVLLPEMNLTIWLKANDADRSVQEFHGILTLTVEKPDKDVAINFGFQFGMLRQQKKSKILAPPTNFEGSLVTVAFIAAKPETSAITTKEMNSGVLIETLTSGIPKASPVIMPTSDYLLIAADSSVKCTTNCILTYHFIRNFKNEAGVEIIGGADNTYEFFGFFEVATNPVKKGATSESEPIKVVMAAVNKLAFATVSAISLLAFDL